MQEWEIPLLCRFNSFLLDSGAFTFMNNAAKHGNVDWLSYADSYADFIKDNHIQHYFELDIDSIKGLEFTEKLRKRIESRCGIQCIPVWHKSRGKEYFEAMVKDYSYVAIGGIVTKEIPTAKYERLFPWFISTARKNDCKIHGLGYTATDKLHKYHFDSIDSTTWTVGQRFGEITKFYNGVIKRLSFRVGGVIQRKVKDPNTVTLVNFKEWLKFCKYAEINY